MFETYSIIEQFIFSHDLSFIHVYGEFVYRTIHLAMLTGKELNVIIDVIAESTVFA